MSISPRPRRSFSCRTTSTPTLLLHLTRHSRPQRRGASPSGSNGISRPSTGAGSIWLSPRLATLSSQCLDRRSPDQRTLEREIEAWVVRRNTHNCKADSVYNRRCPHQAKEPLPSALGDSTH